MNNLCKLIAASFALFVNLAASPLPALHQRAISSLENSENSGNSGLTKEATC